MAQIPRDRAFDGTLALLREGYGFIGNRCRRLRSDSFRTRLLLRPVVCVSGREGAALLYDAGRFTRRGAVPERIQKLLQDKGSVQALDDAAHRRRKQLFLDIAGGEGVGRLDRLFQAQWRRAAEGWAGAGPLQLHDAVRKLLCAAVCEWTGVPLDGRGLDRATREFSAMTAGTGAFGPAHWRARQLRQSNEHWVRGLVDAVRAGRLALPADAPLRVVAEHRDGDGNRLDRRVAAVEVINLLRPTVAVGRFVAFAALALHEHPQAAERLRAAPAGPEAELELECFVQEVRRFYPFFPAIGGVARRDFDWHGHGFRKGDWALLDLYGTNRDARLWERPEEFRPERFRGRDIDADELVPQGGGSHLHGHRCPGEWITIALLKRAVRELLALDYRVPDQDLTVDLARMPALPASGFVIEVAAGPDRDR